MTAVKNTTRVYARVIFPLPVSLPLTSSSGLHSSWFCNLGSKIDSNLHNDQHGGGSGGVKKVVDSIYKSMAVTDGHWSAWVETYLGKR